MKKFDRRLKDRDLALNPLAGTTLRHSFASRFDLSAGHGVYLNRFPLQLSGQGEPQGKTVIPARSRSSSAGSYSLTCSQGRDRKAGGAVNARHLRVAQFLRSDQFFTNGFVIATRPVGDVIFVKTAAYPK